MENKKPFIIAIAIVLGLILGAIILGRSLQRFRTEDRYITVKGFSEREVKADFAVWTIRIRFAGNDLAESNAGIENSKNKVIDFLVKNGIDRNEIVQKDLIVTDKKAQEYSSGGDFTYRYIIDNTVQVRTANVDNVQKVSRMTDELLKSGVMIINREYEGGVKFIFTKLNDIKPEMLAEATKNAKSAAVQFTKESNTRLGGLRKASQGLFTIVDRDDYLTSQSEGGYGGGSGSDIYKKVRVVISVEYSVN